MRERLHIKSEGRVVGQRWWRLAISKSSEDRVVVSRDRVEVEVTSTTQNNACGVGF